MIQQIVWVLRKDLLIEWRGKTRIVALGTYAATLLLLFSFAVGPNTPLLQKLAGAYLWLAILSASTLMLAQSFQTETESGALEGLLMAPVRPAALFYGKAIANLIVLSGLGMVGLLLSFGMFSLQLKGSIGVVLGTLVLGSAGICAPGTLYAALTARLSSQQLMLPVLLFPLVVPTLLAAVKVTALQVQGDPMVQTGSWLTLLVCLNAVFWSLGGVLFEKVIDG